MTAREWLSRARNLDREVDALEEAKRKTWEHLTGVGADPSADRVQSTPNPHRFDVYAEMAALVDSRVDELVAARAEIMRVICMVGKRSRREVLIRYYLNCNSLRQIADDLHYSVRGVQAIKHEGEADVADLLGEKLCV